ncbi:hypothetical protein DBR42_18330 [Pelomonas sp. HMWF004]|nr:hypothetical protein DBR42_18330 [Pelomonas sp. HMWF004]
MITAGLACALVASNIAWAVHALDVGITRTYEHASYSASGDALARAIAVIPLAANGQTAKAELVAAALRAGDTVDVFEKDGVTWIGHLGLQFNADAQLIRACAEACDP